MNWAAQFLAVLTLVAHSAALLGQPAVEKRPPKIICPPLLPGKIQKMVKPVFPAEAKKKKVFGRVLAEMTIDKEGHPKNIRVTNGDPILAEAVLRALPQWRWKPYKLNGQAVEVETTITVNFEPRQ